MTYAYRVLPPNLYDTANAAIDWFINAWGIKKSYVKVEAEFDPEIKFRPTFVAPLKDGQLLCVEVSQYVYSATLDSVALACLRKGVPIQFYTAVPKDVSDPEYQRKFKQAKLAGVGILEVDHQSGGILLSAVSLSLGGVRPPKLADFPPKYRRELQHAEQTFRDGEPSKACSLVYDELESCFRLFAKKSLAKNLWRKSPKLNLEKAPWANLIDEIDRTLDRGKPLAHKVTAALLARIKGVTTHRNESGHKPRTVHERIQRDQRLRTRFEAGVDLFQEFIDATRAFRL